MALIRVELDYEIDTRPCRENTISLVFGVRLESLPEPYIRGSVVPEMGLVEWRF